MREYSVLILKTAAFSQGVGFCPRSSAGVRIVFSVYSGHFYVKCCSCGCFCNDFPLIFVGMNENSENCLLYDDFPPTFHLSSG